METKHYVTFLCPGAFFPEESTREITVRDPNRIDVPENCFAFEFYDVSRVEENGEILTGMPRNKTGRYYVDARILTQEDVEREFPDKTILLSNMRGNGWKHVVLCKTGNFQPFEQTDALIFTQKVVAQ